MPRRPNRFGGGAQTNVNGLRFEQNTLLDEALQEIGFEVREYHVYNGDKKIGMSVPKHKLYTIFFRKVHIDYKKYNSKRWLPDECFINEEQKTAYIIEKKYQNRAGSVDEKLPGCDFKKKEYEKLFHALDPQYKVEYLYVFNNWFTKESYKDVLEYITSVGCHYFFNEIPLAFLGLQSDKS
ncbi:PD-(D/E)XK nuclease superfamily protein [uncultured Veillonella sp.]|uniref:PD-(D/E)XK nuclease superfamily protein n=1 Tax=uncultured Veillonella sp. TaxID=159268 RepID=UPI002596C3FB|nr:PD-(D/E)XK nuclease superfamily protein [uncultured Veillonella sp.]